MPSVTAPVVPLPSRVAIAQLRAQMEAVQRRGRRGLRPDQVHPVPAALAPLLPDGGLKPGAAYCVRSLGPARPPGAAAPVALLLALLAEPSRAGLWCGVVGLPELGVEAAGLAGVTLDRLALVPNPGSQWLAVVATLSGALSVVVVRPPGPVREADAARLAARLRDEETTLLVTGAWPGAEATFSVEESHWRGLGEGYGYLSECETTVQAVSKRYPYPRRVHVLMPAADGTLAAVADQYPAEMAEHDTSEAVAPLVVGW